MKILVVGGTRFFGIPMIAKLLEDGHEVTVATRGNAANPFAGKTQQIIMDRTDAKQVKILAGQLPYLLQYSSSIAVILV